MSIPAPRSLRRRRLIIILIILVALGICALVLFCTDNPLRSQLFATLNIPFETPSNTATPLYSRLTGEEITDSAENTQPTFCVQIPNGSTDGARPQAGLADAAVVFEAIAEAGITRFAAVFQAPTAAIIGPIRSLRPYYLDWDTPFDCTVVHAGGSDEALAAISWGGQRNLDESTTYMWRDSTPGRNWNNLFTSPALLADFNRAQGYTTSNPLVFPRLTPAAADAAYATSGDNSENQSAPELATEISLSFSNLPAYSPVFRYDAATQTYLRSYADGTLHQSYQCPSGTDRSALAACPLVQLAPSVVIALRVQESRLADDYHESITTVGSGTAYIFQRGTVTTATWSKSATSAQLTFTDATGATIAFVPGQIWLAAIPQYGSINYQ